MTGIDFGSNLVVELLIWVIVATYTCAMQQQIVVSSNVRRENDIEDSTDGLGSRDLMYDNVWKRLGNDGIAQADWSHTDYLIAGAVDALGEPFGIVEDFA